MISDIIKDKLWDQQRFSVSAAILNKIKTSLYWCQIHPVCFSFHQFFTEPTILLWFLLATHTHTRTHTPKKVKCVIFARAGYFKTQRTSRHPVNFLHFYLFSLLEVIIATSWYAPIFQDVDFWEKICEESQIPAGTQTIILLKKCISPS